MLVEGFIGGRHIIIVLTSVQKKLKSCLINSFTTFHTVQINYSEPGGGVKLGLRVHQSQSVGVNVDNVKVIVNARMTNPKRVPHYVAVTTHK